MNGSIEWNDLFRMHIFFDNYLRLAFLRKQNQRKSLNVLLIYPRTQEGRGGQEGGRSISVNPDCGSVSQHCVLRATHTTGKIRI
jgi:hypothetical protein